MSPILFNVVVNNVIRTCLATTVEDQRVAYDRLGETFGRCFVVLYADDDMVGLRNSDWLQHEMNVLVGLFRRYVQSANIAKKWTMTC